MPRPSKKKQYTEKAHRVVYAIVNPLTKEFYIDYTLDKHENMRSAYKEHYTCKRNKTRTMILELKTLGHKPCCFKLNTLYGTKVEAYQYVIAWTKILIKNGYINLDQGNISEYVKELFDNTKNIFEHYESIDLDTELNCEKCVFPDYGRKPCTITLRGELHATKHSTD